MIPPQLWFYSGLSLFRKWNIYLVFSTTLNRSWLVLVNYVFIPHLTSRITLLLLKCMRGHGGALEKMRDEWMEGQERQRRWGVCYWAVASGWSGCVFKPSSKWKPPLSKHLKATLAQYCSIWKTCSGHYTCLSPYHYMQMGPFTAAALHKHN